MKKIRKRSYISGALFLPAMVTGFMLSNSSKPPNTFLLTAHKFSTVSDLILLDISTFQKKKAIGLSLGEKIAAITMNVCFVSTIGTGGALSINKPMPDIIHTTHSITPWLTALSSGVLLYLLNNIQ